jgi:hypothetical protein
VFGRLVIAAPSRSLSLVRASLDPTARRAVAGCAATDLTKVRDADLARHFPNWPLVL